MCWWWTAISPRGWPAAERSQLPTAALVHTLYESFVRSIRHALAPVNTGYKIYVKYGMT
jgi:hypothetical protein